jgi:hypothetical protein
MSFVLFLLLLQLSFSICNDLSLNNSNCSLSFTIQTIYQSNIIQKDFTIKFLAYYKITPLTILVVDHYKNEDENIKSMIELNKTQFYFQITQSSTVRLCILSSDDDNDNNHRIYRQIHIGINILLISSIDIYYILSFLREK